MVIPLPKLLAQRTTHQKRQTQDTIRRQVKDAMLEKVRSSGTSAFYQPCGVPVTCTRFNSQGYLAVATDLGSLSIFDTRRDICARCQRTPMNLHTQAHRGCIFELLWLADNQQIVTGGGDRYCRVFDVEACKQRCAMEGHSGSIKAMAQCRTAPEVIVTGGRDGSILLWDLRIGRAVRSNANHNDDNEEDVFYTYSPLAEAAHDPSRKRKVRVSVGKAPAKSVTGVALANSKIITGGSDGRLCTWDIRMMRVKRSRSRVSPLAERDYCEEQRYRPSALGEMSHTNTPARRPLTRRFGINYLDLSPDESLLLVSTTDSRIRTHLVNNSTDYPLVQTYYGHANNEFLIRSKFSADGDYILSGSKDCKARVWAVRGNGRPLLELEGHIHQVNDISDTLSEFGKLVTCSDDSSFRLWRIGDMDRPRPYCDAYACEQQQRSQAAIVGVSRQVGDRACFWQDYITDHEFRTRGWEFIGDTADDGEETEDVTPPPRPAPALRQSTLTSLWGGARGGDDDDDNDEEEEGTPQCGASAASIGVA